MNNLEANKKILSYLEKYVEKFPEERFGQMLNNLNIVSYNPWGSTFDPFHDKQEFILRRIESSKAFDWRWSVEINRAPLSGYLASIEYNGQILYLNCKTLRWESYQDSLFDSFDAAKLAVDMSFHPSDWRNECAVAGNIDNRWTVYHNQTGKFLKENGSWSDYCYGFYFRNGAVEALRKANPPTVPSETATPLNDWQKLCIIEHGSHAQGGWRVVLPDRSRILDSNKTFVCREVPATGFGYGNFDSREDAVDALSKAKYPLGYSPKNFFPKEHWIHKCNTYAPPYSVEYGGLYLKSSNCWTTNIYQFPNIEEMLSAIINSPDLPCSLKTTSRSLDDRLNAIEKRLEKHGL